MPTLKVVRVRKPSGDVVIELQDDQVNGQFSVKALREVVGLHTANPVEVVSLNAKSAVLQDEQVLQELLDAADDGLLEVQLLVKKPTYRLTEHRWELVVLDFPGKPRVTLQGEGMAVRADIILWDDHYEHWNWKAGPALVDTSLKTPLFHSPGVTWGALDHAVKGCSRPCEVVLVSEGWNNPEGNAPGQLPVMDEAKAKLGQTYPEVRFEQAHGTEVQQKFNDLMEQGVSAVLLLHATC